jgi:hypothetical protein
VSDSSKDKEGRNASERQMDERQLNWRAKWRPINERADEWREKWQESNRWLSEGDEFRTVLRVMMIMKKGAGMMMSVVE